MSLLGVKVILRGTTVNGRSRPAEPGAHRGPIPRRHPATRPGRPCASVTPPRTEHVDERTRWAQTPPPNPGGPAPAHSLTVSRSRFASPRQARTMATRAPARRARGRACLAPCIGSFQTLQRLQRGRYMPASHPFPSRRMASTRTPRDFAACTDQWGVWPPSWRAGSSPQRNRMFQF